MRTKKMTLYDLDKIFKNTPRINKECPECKSKDIIYLYGEDEVSKYNIDKFFKISSGDIIDSFSICVNCGALQSFSTHPKEIYYRDKKECPENITK